MKLTILIALGFIVSGCTSIQDEYKPLYQVKPQKEAITVEEK